MKIKEIIVVEGKKDTANLKRWLDVDTLETSGTGLTEATLDQVRQWAKLSLIHIWQAERRQVESAQRPVRGRQGDCDRDRRDDPRLS